LAHIQGADVGTKHSRAVAKCSAARTASDVSGTHWSQQDRPSLLHVDHTQPVEHTFDADRQRESESKERVCVAAVETCVSCRCSSEGVVCIAL